MKINIKKEQPIIKEKRKNVKVFTEYQSDTLES